MMPQDNHTSSSSKLGCQKDDKYEKDKNDNDDDDDDELYGDLTTVSVATATATATAAPAASANEICSAASILLSKPAPPPTPQVVVLELEQRIQQLEQENDTLKRNIGTLYRTAQAEIKRKDQQIEALLDERASKQTKMKQIVKPK